MNASILSAFYIYQQELKNLTQVLDQNIKKKSSIRAACELLAITRSTYYHRQKYPDAWQLPELTKLAPVIGNDIIEVYKTAVEKGRLLTETITDGVQRAGISVSFLCKKAGFNASTYYRNQKEPYQWDLEKLTKVQKIIDTINSLDHLA